MTSLPGPGLSQRVMMSFRVRRPTSYCFLFSLPIILSVAVAGAEVSLKAQVGFHGIFKLGHPFPLSVKLTNLGRPVEGMLEVEVWKGGPSKGVPAYPFTYKREVFLGAQSRKNVVFTVGPDSIARPITVNFSSPGGKVSREVDLRGRFSTSPLILLLTGNSAFPSIPQLYDLAVPVVALSLDELPSDVRAYQGVWAILIYEQSLRDLSRSQRVALERWLSTGGRILVLGGLQYALYQEPSISAFLPVRVVGLRRFPTLPSLERYYGRKVSGLKDLLVQDSRFVEGKVLVEEEGTPILVEMSRGRGKIFYLSLDVGRPPLSQSEGLSLIIADLLGSPVERKPGLWTSWDDAVFSRLLWDLALFGGRTPLLPFLLCLLLYLGGLLVLVRFWQQQKFRRAALVISFFAFLFLISIGGYLYFDRGGHIPDGVLVSLTILEGHPDGYAEVQSNVGLFSTRRRHYRFEMERGWTELAMVPPRSGRTDNAAVVIRDGVRFTVLQVQLKEWGTRLFTIRSMGSFPIRVEAKRRSNRLSLRLTNLSLKDLTECWLVISEEGFFLGDIPPGSSLIREFALSSAGQSENGPGSKRGLREIPFNDKARELLFRYSIFPQDQVMARGESAGFVFGWVEGDSRRIWVHDRRILSRGYTLFRASIRLDEEDEL
ncbi:MAG: hypothetical protein ACE5JU_00150 [Candidatus Binatia bacterium]